ncbi:cellulase family glycosylhydrolase [Chitinophagaceae bacterium LB-8]|uniref:Cellulase family glycosylhydrolase n=1 Tax=Paraflavisolibacter caeni TaxID=2982496 RepID=A0A9X2XZL2_9BACT|nr:cellulase family glycosylhydrolase [Paraflavisolibacter caeni]MCU7551851.1 cellulase family glycosylhydrolase [Paraflavisolibacter caeni]
MKVRIHVLIVLISLFFFNCSTQKTSIVQQREIWTSEQANNWYAKQGWLVGANFIPSNAINQLEMWQAETFDTATINRELAWAESIGMNTMRVFLHDLLHQQDSIGLYQRMDVFLQIAQRHGIKPLFVLFDSCWDPFPKPGKQREPKPHVHNSGWVQSPGQYALKDSTQYPRLEKYVKGVVSRFANDERILGWDIWNEPDNMTGPSYEKVEIPNKVEYVMPLLKKAFAWSRSVNPSQPLTSGIWVGDWSTHNVMKPIEKLQIEESDIISFHNYDNAQEFEKRILLMKRYNKPIICTEYMARPNGSTFQGSLPVAKKYNVAMYNWGFVNGKTQTIYPWDSWTKTYSSEPPVWFHDIFQKNGTAYRTEEVEVIRKLANNKQL